MLDILIPIFILKQTEYKFWKLLTFGIVKQNQSLTTTRIIIKHFTELGFQPKFIKQAISNSMVISRTQNVYQSGFIGQDDIIGDEDGFIHGGCELTTQFKDWLYIVNKNKKWKQN